MLLSLFQQRRQWVAAAVTLVLPWLMLLAHPVEATNISPEILIYNYCVDFSPFVGGELCDFWDPEMTCRYGASVCPGISNPTPEDIFFQTLCKCDSDTGTIVCEEHPSNQVCDESIRTNCPFDPFEVDDFDPRLCTSQTCDYKPYGCPGDDTLPGIFTLFCDCSQSEDADFVVCASADPFCPTPEPPQDDTIFNFCALFNAFEGGEPCDFWDQNQECRYGASVCPGIPNPTREDIFFQTLCKCDSGTGSIVCEEHPSNQICDNSIRTNCPSLPFSDEASQWNPALCTVGGCDYDPFGCPGDDSEPDFGAFCDCVSPEGLICAIADIFCPPPPEVELPQEDIIRNFCDFTPFGGGEPCDFWDQNQECRYGASVCPGISNPTRQDIFFQTLCKCDSGTGTIVCEEHPSNQICDASIRSNCPIDPFSVEAADFDPRSCNGGCDYDPFGCPGDDSEPNFSTFCDCLPHAGLICAQVDVFCPSPTITEDCPLPFFPMPVMGCVCFSGESLVDTKASGILSMKDLRIGDMVKVDKNNNFEPIYSFGHYHPMGSGKFLVFNDALEISPAHMIAVQGRGFIPASSVKIGDCLVGASFEEATIPVKTISTKISQGIFAPFTPSGTIVVNGVVASCFISMQPAHAGDLQIGGIHTRISWHTLAHAFELPRRIVCHYFGQEKYCREETYTADGISTWLDQPFKWALWITNPDNGRFAALLWIPILIVVCVFGTMDKIMSMFSIFSIVLAAALLIIVNRRTTSFTLKLKTW